MEEYSEYVGRERGKFVVIGAERGSKNSVILKLKCKDCGRIQNISAVRVFGQSRVDIKCLCGVKDLVDIKVDNKYKRIYSNGESSVNEQLRTIWIKMLKAAASSEHIRIEISWIEKEENFIKFATDNGFELGMCMERIDLKLGFNQSNIRFIQNEDKEIHTTIKEEANRKIVYPEGIKEEKLATLIKRDEIYTSDFDRLFEVVNKYNLNSGVTSSLLEKHIRKGIVSSGESISNIIHLIQANNIKKDTIRIKRVQRLLEDSLVILKIAQREMEEQQ